jgi:hypothetical protein
MAIASTNPVTERNRQLRLQNLATFELASAATAGCVAMAPYPNSFLGRTLREAAKLINANLGVRAIAVGTAGLHGADRGLPAGLRRDLRDVSRHRPRPAGVRRLCELRAAVRAGRLPVSAVSGGAQVRAAEAPTDGPGPAGLVCCRVSPLRGGAAGPSRCGRKSAHAERPIPRSTSIGAERGIARAVDPRREDPAGRGSARAPRPRADSGGSA